MLGRSGYLRWFLAYGFISSVLVFNLSGCATGPKAAGSSAGPDQDASRAIDLNQRLRQEKHEGSLWENNGHLSSLFKDYKASKVGDIVTIIIVEQPKAYTFATTRTERTNDLSAEISGKYAGFGTPRSYSGEFGSKFGNKSKGYGKTERQGSLKGEISARVIKVLPDGNLVILGSREITVNSETQCLNLSGIIQPRDIRYNKKTKGYEIESSRISDAKFIYSGRGIVAQRQRPGWFSSILDAVWPF